jgi:drug/metabolite transporter (DMT)-like permease
MSSPTAPHPKSWGTDALLLLMSLIWGINFIVVKLGTELLSPLAFNAARVALAAVALTGNVLVLISCLCWATYTVLLKPYTETVDGITLSAVTMVGGAVPLVLVSTPQLVHTSWSALPVSAWGAVAYSGLLALFVAYLFWYRGVRVLGPTRTAMYGNLQPVVALVVAWLALGEQPTIIQLCGAVAIMAGILLTRT